MSIETKKPSKVFFDTLDQIVKIETKTRDLFFKAIEIAKNEGFSDFQIVVLIKEYVKDRLPRGSFYYYMQELKPKLELEQSTSKSDENNQNDDKNDTEEEVQEEEELT